MSETCLNRNCVNPCAVGNPCSLSADCKPTNHKAVCSCPTGLVGNPFIRCYEEPKSKPECNSDSECANDRSCVNQRCQDPCSVSNPCGTNAQCKTNFHRPTCRCPDGWAGNPQVACYKRSYLLLNKMNIISNNLKSTAECRSDNECPYNKACINENCRDPCSSHNCGRGAECLVQNHRATCQCPAGMQGDPLLACISGVCQYNEDCADHEACDRLNRVCRPVCDDDTCAETANCIGQQHQPKCHCPPGTKGNPFVECIGAKQPEPECRSDSDCSSQLACINQLCKNPCSNADVCTPGQECRILDTLPLRTIMCTCPPDTIADSAGRCKAIIAPKPECVDDSECPDSDKCVSNTCVEACKVDLCGVNALCNSLHHQAICTCAPAYTGNPHVECVNSKSSFLIVTLVY